MGVKACGLIGLFVPVLALAEEVDPFSLSLTDLSQVRVTVSSHRPESRLETPAIVTRLNVEEMRALGLTQLTDILSFVPGMQVQNHLFGQPFVSVRGIYEGFNQKVLFLLDDTPYFMSSHSDVPLKGIPLDAISHVEIIRGPGAVYYGTNATAGVIKVVTKKHIEHSQVELTMSEDQAWHLGGVSQYAIDKQQSIFVAAQVEAEQETQVTYPAFDTFAEGDVEQKSRHQSVYVRYQHANTRLYFHGFESEFTGLAQPRDINNINTLTYKAMMISASHDWQPITDHKVRLFADYNQFYLNFDVQDFNGVNQDGGFRVSDSGENNYRSRLGMNWDTSINDMLTTFAGLEWERRSTGDYEVFDATTDQTTGTIMPAFHLDELSLYGQADVRPYEQGRLFLGFRYTDNDIIGESVVPRFGFVHSLSQNSSVKLLYSEGFNTPSFTQLKADFNGLVNGNENLDAERVASHDVGYYWQDENINAGVTLFYYIAHDFVYSDRSGGSIDFYNSEAFEHAGLELEWEQNASKQMKWFANASYLFDGNEADGKDNSATYSPEYTVNIGMNWWQRVHRLGTSIRYVSERASADAMTLWDMSYQYTWQQTQYSVVVKNALADDQLQPNMAEFNDRLVPNGSPEQVIEFSVKYVF
ncbi:MAG: TonB-dependent receptor [Gammaproteobacteria bacterium]|nr:TonB-dependent receptor [Gammaproteobacteria bacterium]